MFAAPFSTPLSATLASHVFGRFMPQRAQAGVAEAVVAPAVVPVLASTALDDDDGTPDLAQRVRDVGEW